MRTVRLKARDVAGDVLGDFINNVFERSTQNNRTVTCGSVGTDKRTNGWFKLLRGSGREANLKRNQRFNGMKDILKICRSGSKVSIKRIGD